MKIIHFSDTHLGFNDLDILDENYINQREADFYDSFSQIVKQIRIIKPDYIIHTGDLFHRSSPSNRAISFALEQFKIIDSLNIPFIIIAGNHSTPKTRSTLPILNIFENFKNIHLSYNQEYKKVEFEDVVFHTIPHITDDSKVLNQIDICEKNIAKDKKNIMMLHCSVGLPYLMEEFGETVFPKEKEYVFEKMDYVALGHWHGFGSVGKHKNVYYSGSTERTSLNDKRNSKGFIELTIDDKLTINYKEIKIRPIVTKEIDCDSYEDSLAKLDTTDSKHSIVEVTLKNITPLQSLDIQNSFIKNLFKDSMDVNIKRVFKNSSQSESLENIEAVSLEDYFLEHLKVDSNEKEYTRLKTKVQELFRFYEEENNDTY